MQWDDDAIVLGGRRFGEGGLVLSVLTRMHGRQAGLVHGGASRKRRGQFEPGNDVRVSWRGRLEDQLGRFEVAEVSRARASRFLDAPDALAALRTVAAILQDVLTEGDRAASALFEPTGLLLDTLEHEAVWPALYVRWELGLLTTLGFGLDLSHCAVTGTNDGLTHVSPRTGRAVRGSDVPEYRDRLLELPGFLTASAMPAGPSDLWNGLQLTEHFLRHWLYASLNKDLPNARSYLLSRLQTSRMITAPPP